VYAKEAVVAGAATIFGADCTSGHLHLHLHDDDEGTTTI
jgi:hypothetical protein